MKYAILTMCSALIFVGCTQTAPTEISIQSAVTPDTIAYSDDLRAEATITYSISISEGATMTDATLRILKREVGDTLEAEIIHEKAVTLSHTDSALEDEFNWSLNGVRAGDTDGTQYEIVTVLEDDSGQLLAESPPTLITLQIPDQF